MTWGWQIKNESHVTGGAKGTPAEAKVPDAWPDYEAEYLKKRLYSANQRFDTHGWDESGRRFELGSEEKGVYLDKVSDNYKDEAEECLKEEFMTWLEGRHESNYQGANGLTYPNGGHSGPHRRHVYEGEVGAEKGDWVPTDWGNAQLTHLPGVRGWLRGMKEHSEKAELNMNLLAEHGPQNLEEAWMYFKHWVKKRPVKVDECLVKPGSWGGHPGPFARVGPQVPTYDRSAPPSLPPPPPPPQGVQMQRMQEMLDDDFYDTREPTDTDDDFYDAREPTDTELEPLPSAQATMERAKNARDASVQTLSVRPIHVLDVPGLRAEEKTAIADRVADKVAARVEEFTNRSIEEDRLVDGEPAWLRAAGDLLIPNRVEARVADELKREVETTARLREQVAYARGANDALDEVRADDESAADVVRLKVRGVPGGRTALPTRASARRVGLAQYAY